MKKIHMRFFVCTLLSNLGLIFYLNLCLTTVYAQEVTALTPFVKKPPCLWTEQLLSELKESAWDGEICLGKEKSLNLVKNQPQVTIYEYENDLYYIDGNSLVSGNAYQLFKSALDYESYPLLLPPDGPTAVQACKVIQNNQAGDRSDLFVWTKMKYETSIFVVPWTEIVSYYLKVQAKQKVFTDSDFLLRWKQENPENHSGEGWNKAVKSYFSIFEGSWYIEPLSKDLSYVRYFLKVKVNHWAPKSILDDIIKTQLKAGVKDLILAFKDKVDHPDDK